MNIRVDLNTSIKDGTEVVFRSPVDCSQVTGLIVYYTGGSQEFVFADAHGNNVGDIDHLFAENVAVKVILDTTTSMAFVQNADTNAYLEGRFADIEAQIGTGGGGAVAEKQYELIEDITLEEAVASIKRSSDVDGNPYNFSAIIITVDSPAAASAQVIFKIMDSSKNLVYHQISQALTTSGNMVFCKVYNDRGLVEYYVGSAKLDSAATLSRKPNYVIRSWENVNNFTLSTYSSSTTVPFPAGTNIKIYAIRG